MATLSDYRSAVKAATRDNIDDLRRDFERLINVSAKRSPGEEAYWTLSRTDSEWRLPADDSGAHASRNLLMLPVRDEYYANNAYLAVIPQPVIMHRAVARVLERYARDFFAHYPEEDSLARREHGVPMLIGRFDVIVDKQGGIQVCELDDVCSLWPALPQINPIAESYVHELENQMGLPIYTAELFQYTDGPQPISPLARRKFARISFYDDDGAERVAYIPRTTSLEMAILQQNGIERRNGRGVDDFNADYHERLLRRTYLHNEDYWRGDISDAWLLKGKNFSLDEVALSVRAFRDATGFHEHMDRYGKQSITMAWERDSKWSLVAEGLAVLADNLKTAVAFGEAWQKEHPGALLVFKTLYSARTEHTAIYSSRGTKLKGVSSATQIERKFGEDAAGPIVIQPFKEPDSLAQAGVKFIGTLDDNLKGRTYTDRKLIRSVEHIGSVSPGERVVAGMESHFAMIFRSFVVYLPKEKRLVHIGGMWQATDGRIVHGGAHSVAGPLYVDGLMSYPSAEKKSVSLQHAEAMLRKYSRA